MRKKVLMFVSILMSLCIPVTAQRNNMDSLLLRLQEFGRQTGVKVERIKKTHEYVDMGLSVKTDMVRGIGYIFSEGGFMPSKKPVVVICGCYREDRRSVRPVCP